MCTCMRKMNNFGRYRLNSFLCDRAAESLGRSYSIVHCANNREISKLNIAIDCNISNYSQHNQYILMEN